MSGKREKGRSRRYFSPFTNILLVMGPLSVSLTLVLIATLLGSTSSLPYPNQHPNPHGVKVKNGGGGGPRHVKFVGGIARGEIEGQESESGSEEFGSSESNSPPEYFRTEHSLLQTDYDLSSWGVRNWDLEGEGGRLGKGFIRLSHYASLWNLRPVEVKDWEVNLQVRIHKVKGQGELDSGNQDEDDGGAEKVRRDEQKNEAKNGGGSNLVFWYTRDKVRAEGQGQRDDGPGHKWPGDINQESGKGKATDFDADFDGLAIVIHSDVNESSIFAQRAGNEDSKIFSVQKLKGSQEDASSRSDTKVIDGCKINLVQNSRRDSWIKIRYEGRNLTVSVDTNEGKKPKSAHLGNHNDWVDCLVLTHLDLPLHYFFGFTTFPQKPNETSSSSSSSSSPSIYYDIFTVTTYEIALDEKEHDLGQHAEKSPTATNSNNDSDNKMFPPIVSTSTSTSAPPPPAPPKNRSRSGEKSSARASPVQIQMQPPVNKKIGVDQSGVKFKNERPEPKLEQEEDAGDDEESGEIIKDSGKPAFFRTKVYFIHLSILLAVVALLIFVLTLYPKYPKHYHVYWRRF